MMGSSVGRFVRYEGLEKKSKDRKGRQGEIANIKRDFISEYKKPYVNADYPPEARWSKWGTA